MIKEESINSASKFWDDLNKKSLSPQEASENHIVVGRVGRGRYEFAFYNPHNAHFYFRFDKWNFKPDLLQFRKVNSSEFLLESFSGCRIVVKKKLIEVTNKIEKERRFKVEFFDGRIDDAVQEAQAILELECVDVLKGFVKLYGGSSDFVCVKRHIPDNKLLHDRVVDSLSLDSTWNDDVSKKVYNTLPLNVEFKKPVYAAKYIRNAALLEFAPDIVKELDLIRSERVEFDKALALYTEQINLHLKVEERTLDALNKISGHFSRVEVYPPNSVEFTQSEISSQSSRVEVGRDDVDVLRLTDSNSLPTISIQDMKDGLKNYRLMRAKTLLRQWGWNCG